MKPPKAPGDPSPSALIGARLGLVPFLDHAGLLAKLIGWMNTDEPFAVRVLTGPAGAGKSRTAQCLCRHARRRAWLAGTLAADAGTAAMADLTRASAPILVVVENAETRYRQLATLVPSLVEHSRPGRSARLMLTLRDQPVVGGCLDVLRSVSDDLNLGLGRDAVYDLAEHPLDVAARRRLLSDASTALATHLSVPLRGIGDPGESSSAMLSTPLLVVMSAYLLVHGESLPESVPELLDRFLDGHEDPYWSRQAASLGTPALRETGVRRRTAALATLAGASNEADALRLLALIGGSPSFQEHRVEIARWAAGLQEGPSYWNPQQPDLLAEHLVATTWGNNPGVLSEVLSGAQPRVLSQPVRLLARATFDRPQMIPALRAVLDRCLGHLCDHAARDPALAAALADLVQACPPDPTALSAILDQLPAHSDLGTRHLARVLNQQLERYCRSRAQDDPDEHRPMLAIALNNLSVRLADLGHRDEALAAAGDAVSCQRDIAHTGPNGRPNLAIMLSNQSLRLAETGHPDQATTAIREAVGLFRTLAETDPASYRPHLAASLHDLAQRLVETGRQQPARAAVTEAVRLYRRLAEGNSAYLPSLASALQDLAGLLYDLGLRKEAGTRHAEAATLLRPGAKPRRHR